jgi:hypothetical protein
MAEPVRFGGVQVTKRNPWGVWGLTLVTLGIYGIVWWYGINREVRDYSAAVGRPIGNSPARAALSVSLGALVVVPAVISWLHTARRIRAIEDLVAPGPAAGPSGGLTALLALVGSFHTVYLQTALNGAWDSARAGRTPVPAPEPAPVAA